MERVIIAIIALITMVCGFAQPAMPDWVTSSVPTLAEIDDSLRMYETPPTQKHYAERLNINKRDAELPDSIELVVIALIVELDSELHCKNMNFSVCSVVIDGKRYFMDGYKYKPEIEEFMRRHKEVFCEWAKKTDYSKYLPYLRLKWNDVDDLCVFSYRLINARTPPKLLMRRRQ